MSALDHIKWSDTDYCMKDFVEFFGYSLPVLCQSTTGYSGCDDDIHQVAADEIYWVYEILRQERIVAKDKHGRYISIPVENCKYKFQTKNNNKVCSGVTTNELLENLRKGDFSKIEFMFDGDQSVSYQCGADMGNNTRFGLLKLVESYEEKYLLGFGMHSGNLFARTVGIPVYLDISLTRAIGFHGDEKGDHQFKRWMADVKTLVDAQRKTAVRTCREVIVFPERPCNGDYEYIHPKSLFDKMAKKPNNDDSVNDAEKKPNEYSYVISTPAVGKPNRTETNRTEPNRTESVQNKEMPPLPVGEIPTIALPPMPRRRPPAIPTDGPTGPVERRQEESLKVEEGGDPPTIPARGVKNRKIVSCGPARRRKDPVERSIDSGYGSMIGSRLPEDESQVDHYDVLRDESPDYSYENLNLAEASDPDEQPIYEVGYSGFVPAKNPPTDDEPPVEGSTLTHSSSNDGYARLPSTTTQVPSNQLEDQPLAANAEESTSPVSVGTGSRYAGYTSAAQVPADEDVESWTVRDVFEVLRLLKMNQYCKGMEEQDVDGALLLSLDENTLVEQFGFKLFEATKFFMFVRKGWRPK